RRHTRSDRDWSSDVCSSDLLLKLQRWSYDSTIALHLFWLVSLLTSQLSSNYQTYTLLCLKILDLDETYPVLNRIHLPQWVSATRSEERRVGKECRSRWPPYP